MRTRVLATFHTTLNPLGSYKLFLNGSIIVPNWRRCLDYRSQSRFDSLNRIALRSSKPEAGDSLRTVRGPHPARSRRPWIRSQSDRTVESSVSEEFFALHLVPERIERLRNTRYVVITSVLVVDGRNVAFDDSPLLEFLMRFRTVPSETPICSPISTAILFRASRCRRWRIFRSVSSSGVYSADAHMCRSTILSSLSSLSRRIRTRRVRRSNAVAVAECGGCRVRRWGFLEALRFTRTATA